jgi:hypothetical protein
MGDRYVLEITCPKCGFFDDEVPYAPTCGFVSWKCQCGHLVDLEQLTGISYEETSNAEVIEQLVKQTSKSETLREYLRKEIWAIYKIDCEKRQFFGDTAFGPMWKSIPDHVEIEKTDLKIDGLEQVDEWLDRN